MIVLVNRLFVRKGFNGITLWPFIVVRLKDLVSDKVFMNHEKIHLRQQIELLVLPFYLWYGIEFIVRLVQYKNRNLAYRNICFEREAYKNEKDLYYLKQRPFWKFIRFI